MVGHFLKCFILFSLFFADRKKKQLSINTYISIKERKKLPHKFSTRKQHIKKKKYFAFFLLKKYHKAMYHPFYTILQSIKLH